MCFVPQVHHAVVAKTLTAVVRVVLDESQSASMTYGGRTSTNRQRKRFLTRHTHPHGSVAATPTPTFVSTTPILRPIHCLGSRPTLLTQSIADRGGARQVLGVEG